MIYYKGKPLMHFERGNLPALEAIFRAGEAPRPESLCGGRARVGEWAVEMVSGPAPSLGGWPRHRKQFARMGDELVGCNLLGKDWHWGWFKTFETSLDDGGCGSLLLDYHVVENGDGIVRRLREEVRKTSDPDVLVGKLCVVWFGRPRFLGHFTLTRMGWVREVRDAVL